MVNNITPTQDVKISTQSND